MHYLQGFKQYFPSSMLCPLRRKFTATFRFGWHIEFPWNHHLCEKILSLLWSHKSQLVLIAAHDRDLSSVNNAHEVFLFCVCHCKWSSSAFRLLLSFAWNFPSWDLYDCLPKIANSPTVQKRIDGRVCKHQCYCENPSFLGTNGKLFSIKYPINKPWKITKNCANVEYERVRSSSC